MLHRPGDPGWQAPATECPYVPLVQHDAADLLSRPAPPRAWIVPGLIPAREVTLLSGDGGGGKTTLALQLGHARACGWTWLDREVTSGHSLYYGAEDDRDELHWRLEQIAAPVLAGPLDPGALTLITVAGEDAELAIADRETGVRPTARLLDLEQRVRDLEVTLLILDAAADAFGGDEIRRREVRAFIRLLRGMADRCGCAVLLLAHPSADGIRSGTGTSGSTHWSNAVRSRLYLRTPTVQGSEEPDPDLRELTLMKANRAPRGQRLTLRWRDGQFVTEHPGAASDVLARGHARRVFMDLLAVITRQGQRVSDKVGTSYAPSRMAKEPEGRAIGNARLQGAMLELLREGHIHVREEGPPSRRRSFLTTME